MAHEKVHVICENLCLEEGMTKGQINGLVQEEKNRLQNQINSLSSGSPLKANSKSEMTDTSRIYVLTTDGNWYYYDGSDWVSGGVYQATVNNDIVDILNYKDILKSNLNVNDYVINLDFVSGVISSAGALIANAARLTSEHYLRFSPEDMIYIFDDYEFAFALFDKDGGFNGYYKTTGVYSLAPSYITRIKMSDVYDKYPSTDSVRIMIRRTDSANIDVSEGDNLFVDSDYRKIISMLNQSQYKDFVNFDIDIWENKVVHTDGTFRDNSKRILYPIFFSNKYIDKIEVPQNSDLKFDLFVYDNDFTAIGYLKNEDGTTGNSPTLFTSLDLTKLDSDKLFIIFARHTEDIEIETSDGYDINFYLKTPYLLKEFINLTEFIKESDGGIVIDNKINPDNPIWSAYNSRLSFGMWSRQAPVPTINEQQFINKGTLILLKGGEAGARTHNRFGYHVLEAYDNTFYNRLTLLVDKHLDYGEKTAEFYYYMGSDHSDSSYGRIKIGSDVKGHSFYFSRDEMIANGRITLNDVISLGRISPSNGLIDTYDNINDVDENIDPESEYSNNRKAIKYLSLKNAQNGAMFYDTDRHKVVVKVNGQWCDMQTTPVPEGTYDF